MKWPDFSEYSTGIVLFLVPLLLIAIFLFFYHLGSNYLTNWDEAWFASVAKDMVKSGDFLNGKWNGGVWFYEPPLLTWILAIVLKFTDSHFWLRSFSAFCSIMTVVITFFLASRIAKNYLAGVFSALVLISNIEFLFRGRQINTELPLTLFLTLAVFAALMSNLSQKKYWLLLMFASLGLALLTKRATTFMVLPALIYLIVISKSKLLGAKNLFYGFIILALIAFPWYILNFLKWGTLFWREFFIGYTWGKIFSVNQTSGTSPLFYIESLAHSFKFFFLVIPFALAWLSIVSVKDKKIRFLLIYLATFFSLLTFASIKASWYILPAYPIFAVVVGVFLWRITESDTKVKLALTVSVIFIALFQIVHWWQDFVVADTTKYQAKLAIAAKNLTSDREVVYLDDFWLPVATFYSDRKIIPLRFNRVKEEITNIQVPSKAFVMTNEGTFDVLETRSSEGYDLIDKMGDLMLVKAR